MKILLINPPFNSFSSSQAPELLFPLSLGYLASSLIQVGYTDLEILDTVAEDFTCRSYGEKFFNFGMTSDAIRERVARISPSIVGITCSFTKRWPNTVEVARLVKEVDPNIKVLVGGAHPSALPDECAKSKYVDSVVIGEGEGVITCLLTKGVHKFKYIENLDLIPFPARHLVDMTPYLVGKRDNFITSRGCPYDCTYCSIHCVWGNQWRARSPKNIVDELEECVSNYEISIASFMDDNLTLNRDRTIKLCNEMIDRGLSLYWNIPNGSSANHLDLELLQLMSKSGCYAINLAVESGNEDILHNVMNKKVSLKRIRDVVSWCKEANLKTLAYYILGMPGETRSSMIDTLKFALELETDVVNVLIATPYPGSKLYNLCVREGYIKTKDFNYYTAFNGVIDTPWLKASEVEEFAVYFREEYEKFYDSKYSIQSSKIRDSIRRPSKQIIEEVRA